MAQFGTRRALVGLFFVGSGLFSSAACERVPPDVPARPTSDPAARSTSLPVLIVGSGKPEAPVASTPLRCDGQKLLSGESLFCYDPTPRTWSEAEAECQRNGGHLAHIESAAEAKAVRDVFGFPYSLPPSLLIGLVEPFREGEWGWMSGKLATHQNWNAGEPNDAGGEDCGEILTATGKWNDIDCRSPRAFLCEAPAAAGKSSAFKCNGTLIQAGATTYCAHTRSPLPAAQADTFCKAAGGHLADLSTAEKDAAFFQAIRPRVDGDVWLGATDARREGEFLTPTGERLGFTAWRDGEPNNVGDEDCAVWGPADGKWNDIPCTVKASSLCRGAADPSALTCGGPLPFSIPGCHDIASGAVAVTASASADKGETAKAVDGDCQTGWNAGAGPQQHWQIDLGSVKDVHGVTLVPGMSPATAPVAHDVSVSTDGRVFRVMARYDGAMTHGKVYPVSFGAAAKARFVRVTTTTSPSWVSWQEVGVFECP